MNGLINSSKKRDVEEGRWIEKPQIKELVIDIIYEKMILRSTAENNA